MRNERHHLLPKRVRFALFTTSYVPLFTLIILRQAGANTKYLSYGGINTEAFLRLLKHFGVSVALITLMGVGLFFLVLTMRNLERQQLKGFPVAIKEVRNRNAESISYIGTYIIPFLFEDYSSLFSVVALTILLVVIYFIYINSTLLLINPLLNLKYSLYEVDFVNIHGGEVLQDRPRNGMILTSERMLEEDDPMLFQRMGHKLYFAHYASLRTAVHGGTRDESPGGGTSRDPTLSDYS